MGVSIGKAWRLGMLSTNIALLPNNNKRKQHVCSQQQQQQQRKINNNNNTISWSLVCGFMLFVLGLISLLTGHMLSDLEWYSHRLVHPRLVIVFFSCLI
jgi:hypothetical protein